MYVMMKTNLGTPFGPFTNGERYDVPDAIGGSWVRAGHAYITLTPPPFIEQLLARLEDGAGKACLFLPFVGEFGHQVMSHIRIVHFHKSSRKYVCCRPGEEVLYPSAMGFITDWRDPVRDADRISTMRYQPIEWPQLTEQFPYLHCIKAGGLTPQQEIHCIEPGERIPFRPRRRGLRADVLLGVRRRDFAPERNWQHWQQLADAVRIAGYTFGVIGAGETTFDLAGQQFNTRDYDTDATIEALQNCRLYVGQDSGNSHLAATVGSPMLLFRETRSGSRDLTGRMAEVNPGRVDVVAGGWDDAAAVARRIIDTLRESGPPCR